MPAPELLTMSRTEIDRLDVVRRVTERRLTRVEAALQLGLSARQVSRLVLAFARDGADGLVSKKRGKRSNRAFTEELKANVLGIVREHYADFGPTLIVEHLAERHGTVLSRETVRAWMIEAGFWVDRRTAQRRVYQPRYRRESFGELIQIDGSEHAWFEDRGPKACLLVFVDDATSRIVELRFCAAESTFDYMHSARRYLERHGKPVAFYSDKHSVFRVNKKEAVGGTGMTQFGRALNDLNIDIIHAHSSQAKGRVERMNLTLQDRLVKAMRLEGIDDINAGNAFLPSFAARLNERFGKVPSSPTDLHRPLTDADDLDAALSWQEQRTVSNSLSVQYDRVMYLLEPNELTTTLRRKQVMVFDHPDGTIELKHDGIALPYSVFDKVGSIKDEDIVDNKRLGAVLAFAKAKQEEIGAQRSKKAPGRRGQKLIQAERTRQANPALR